MTRDQFIASSYSHRRPYRRSCCGSSAQDADTNMAQFIGFGTKKKTDLLLSLARSCFSLLRVFN